MGTALKQVWKRAKMKHFPLSPMRTVPCCSPVLIPASLTRTMAHRPPAPTPPVSPHQNHVIFPKCRSVTSHIPTKNTLEALTGCFGGTDRNFTWLTCQALKPGFKALTFWAWEVFGFSYLFIIFFFLTFPQRPPRCH